MSLRTRMILLFVLMLFGTVGALGAFVFSGWMGEVRRAVNQTAEWTAADVADRLDRFVEAPLHLVQVNHDLLERGIVSVSDEVERERFFTSSLHSHAGSSVLSFALGLDTGEYYGERWSSPDKMELVRSNATTGGSALYYAISTDGTAGLKTFDAGPYDPRTRDWFLAAKQADAEVFSPVYSHFIARDLALSVGRTVQAQDGTWSGVLAAHITLGQINQEVMETSLESGAQTIVLEVGTGYLVGNSLGTANFLFDEKSNLIRRPLSAEVNRPFHDAYNAFRTDGLRLRRARFENGLATVLTTEYKRAGIDWLILTVVPESLFNREAYERFWISAILSVLLLLVASFLFVGMSNRYLQPIRELIHASSAFSSGDLTRRATLSRHDEIGELVEAFNGMADTISAQVENLEGLVVERTGDFEQANRTLEESEERLRLILDSTAEAIYGLDREGRCTFCNASCVSLLGYQSPKELLGRNMHEAVHHSHMDGQPFDEEDCPIFHAIRDRQGIQVSEDTFWRADGTSVEVSYHAYPQLRDGKLMGAVVSFMDITESKRTQERIRYLGTHDALTGLFNRPAFDEALRQAEREELEPVSILFGDVNGLKLTNDVFGHEAGDRLLKTSADILMRICREEDTVARVGGDEFTVLLPFTGTQGALQLRDRILQAFSETTVSSVRCSISVGVATRTERGVRLEEVLKHAEEEMYRAKALERNRNDNSLIGNLMDTLFEKAPMEKEHAEAVGRICARIGKALNLPEPDMRRLREAARLHDIGKIVLDEQELGLSELQDIHAFENPLSEAFRRHVLVGFRILNLSGDTVDLAESVLAHHEHWDGSGYPKGIRGEEIPLISRILSLAEHFEDQMHARNHDTMGVEAIEAYFRKGAGTLFDPHLVEVFLQLLAKPT